MRDRLIGLALACVAALGRADAAELVYVSEPGCPYCRAFDERIGPIYGKSTESRQAPIRRVERADLARMELRIDRPVRYTPTFILAEGGAEIGRIEGYPGEDFFWAMLQRLLVRLPAASSVPEAIAVRP